MVQFRSETMKHGVLILPTERAHDFVDLLGKKANMQFIDMNVHSMRRQYKRYIQRIDEMERMLRFLMEEIKKIPGVHIAQNNVDSFLQHDGAYNLDSVEDSLRKMYEQFIRFRDNNTKVVATKNAAIEERAVARTALQNLGGDLAGIARNTANDSQQQAGLLDVEEAGVGYESVRHLAGVILTADQERFARTVFRASRGNVFTAFDAIPEPMVDAKTNKPVQKSVFVVYFIGSNAPQSALREKMTKICQAFGVNVYDWPKNHDEAQKKMQELDDTINDKTKTLLAYEEYFIQETQGLLEPAEQGGNSLIEEWRLFCVKEQSIYATLNLFEGGESNLRADCWYPAAEEGQIQQILSSMASSTSVSAFLIPDKADGKSHKKPPTYIRTTDFTSSFQGMVDTYGVPRYKEANPALLTIITFPFLFGIMYGDIGHGSCLLAFGLFLIYIWPKVKNSQDEMVQMIAGGRYMITLMGCFAVYAGFLYNDFFSLGVNIFGTRYKTGDDPASDSFLFKPDKSGKFPYPFGFDPIWKGATNELLFFNSFKMKLSVIVGGIQMVAGVFMKCLNCVYFRDYLSFFFEFIPQMGFMLSLVGWMDFLIFYKWATPDKGNNKPRIITNIIDMCMLKKSEIVAFKGQQSAQTVLLPIMILCIPMMLFPKPLILLFKHKSHQKRLKQGSPQADSPEGALEAGGLEMVQAPEHEEEEEEEFDTGEIFIEQMIETIEFVLGTISNTASYLRLWALSLAHQQLSLVFFNMIILNILKMKMGAAVLAILLFFAFAVFAAITFGVMLCMDTLECFLHALRLQWVEFQNKFYKADGYKFFPFNFRRVLVAKEE